MKKYVFLLLSLLIISCGKEQHDLVVKTTIKGLKKGTIYLKKVKDTALITVDSLIVNGNTEFELHSVIESPEMFFLYLDKNSNENNRIPFFADKGITEIKTSLKSFALDFEINGSPQQKLYEEYEKLIKRFNDKNLDLIKESFDAQIEGDSSKLNAVNLEADNMVKRKYLYTVNFALNNKDSEVAPYLVLTEIYNAQIKFLDTINNSLTPKVKNSKYGKELQSFINNRKKAEQAN